MKFILAIFLIINIDAIENWELERAYKPLPTNSLLLAPAGHLIPEMINKSLLNRPYMTIFDNCENFSLEELDDIYAKLYDLKSDEFDDIYNHADDRRKLRHSEGSLRRNLADENTYIKTQPDFEALRAGKCGEILMLYTHHVSEDIKSKLDITLPLMDENPLKKNEINDEISETVDRQLTCFSCHLKVNTTVSDNTMTHGNFGSCEDFDGNPHKWDRVRRCDESCFDPVCGLCEGIGGIATSDAPNDYTPTSCEVVGTAAQIRAAGIVPVIPVWPEKFTNGGFYETLIGIKNDPFCLNAFPGPNSTFTNCYIQQEGTIYFDNTNQRLRIDYNRYWGKIGGNLTEHIYHGQDASKPYVMNIVIKKFMAGLADFCVCASPGSGIVQHDCFSDATYLGRENLGIEYLWVIKQVDHWVKGPHHFWVDVLSGNIIRMWQPWNGLEVLDPEGYILDVANSTWDKSDRAA
eukprot:UN06771